MSKLTLKEAKTSELPSPRTEYACTHRSLEFVLLGARPAPTRCGEQSFRSWSTSGGVELGRSVRQISTHVTISYNTTVGRQHTISKVGTKPLAKLLEEQTDIIWAVWLIVFRRTELEVVLEVCQCLLPPYGGFLKIRSKGILVSINGVIPYEEANSEKHGRIKAFPVGVWPPKAGEQTKIASFELVASSLVWHYSMEKLEMSELQNLKKKELLFSFVLLTFPGLGRFHREDAQAHNVWLDSARARSSWSYRHVSPPP